jgi:hypothetical protein
MTTKENTQVSTRRLKIQQTGAATDKPHIYPFKVRDELRIDLGWPGIVRRDRDYYSADEADSGDINDILGLYSV